MEVRGKLLPARGAVRKHRYMPLMVKYILSTT